MHIVNIQREKTLVKYIEPEQDMNQDLISFKHLRVILWIKITILLRNMVKVIPNFVELSKTIAENR